MDLNNAIFYQVNLCKDGFHVTFHSNANRPSLEFSYNLKDINGIKDYLTSKMIDNKNLLVGLDNYKYDNTMLNTSFAYYFKFLNNLTTAKNLTTFLFQEHNALIENLERAVDINSIIFTNSKGKTVCIKTTDYMHFDCFANGSSRNSRNFSVIHENAYKLHDQVTNERILLLHHYNMKSR